mgnify:CR=1 FL=1
MKLISEHFSDDVEYITEQKQDGKKDYKLKGVHNIHSTSLLDREGRHMTKGKVAQMREKYGDSDELNQMHLERYLASKKRGSGPKK